MDSDDKVTILSGETYTLDGVTYTALEDAQLNLDSDGKVSGIASGSVQATVTDAETSPTVTFDATDGAFNFTATSNGEVITITPFPIEFISGEFTYNGGRLNITTGSDMAINTQRGDYILRNENHFVNDSAYIFTATSLTSDAEHVISKFSLTNGTDTRELNLEQLGPVVNNFTESGFTLVQGSSEVLNMGNYKLIATASNADAGLNMDLGEAGLTFVPNTGDGTLTVVLTRNGNTIFGGELECTNGSITLGYDHAVTFSKDTSFNFTTPNNTVLTVTAADEATTNIVLTDNGITFTPGTGDGGLNIAVTKKGSQVFAGSLNITDGTITFDTDEKRFSFTDGTKIALGIGSLELGVEVVGDTTVGEGIGASFTIEADANGNLILTPDENGGSFNISLKRDEATLLQNSLMLTASSTDDDDDTLFENNVTVNGPVMFNPETSTLTLKDGTEISLAFKDYTLTATAKGDAASKISLTEEGIAITPELGDGKLNLAMGSTNGSMSVDIEVLSGGFVFGLDETLNVVEGTELQITFSEDYIVNFKTTDAAGGALSIDENGITFAPNAEDGSLELSVTRNGETRTTSLDVTGSLTYKLDGSISLAQGTVVKNVFEDGNVLTITANTDATGSILFSPQDGVTITPAESDALNVLFTSGDVDVFNITSINGSVNYKGGVITASDGTEARYTNYYMESEMLLSTTGGSASIIITEDTTSYVANTGATFVLDYLDGTTLKITGGKFTDDYVHAIITEGSVFRTNDDEDYFVLETAGNYIINGMNITTTADNVQVVLSDYDTITFEADAGIVFDGQEFSGDGTVTLSDGAITLGNGSSLTKTFESGNVVKVTANVDDCGTITVTDNGITVTPSAADAMTVQETFTFGPVYNLTNIEGTFGIEDNTFKFTDGAVVSGAVTVGGNNRAVNFSASDGNASVEILNGAINYVAEDGATLSTTVDEDVIRINGGGTVASAVVDGVHQISIDNGINISADTGYSFSLDADGSYTLNGMNVAASNNAEVYLTDYDKVTIDGISYTPLDEDVTLTIGEAGTTCAGGKVQINDAFTFDVTDGSISYDNTTNKFTCAAGTAFYLQDDSDFKVVATEAFEFTVETGDDTSSLTFTDANLNLVNGTRTAAASITGSIVYGTDGSLALENGTEMDIAWEDGNKLKLTSTGSTGSIAFDADKGIKITSNDENLSMTLTTSYGYSTNVNAIKGSLWYNAGEVSFETNSVMTATSTLGGQPILTTLEAVDGTANISFNTTNGVLYSADTGALKITWARDDLESTFTINSGTIQIGHNLFRITEGTDLATDLKDFVPALYFTTAEAGTYTINGQTITTSAANLALTATDDQMVFTTSDDVVSYEGMTFTGNGNVSLKADNVVLGAGVVATGFGEGNSFVLAEAGNVTADAKIFELTELDTPITIPMEITVTGAQDGFIFSRTLTKESEAYLDDALTEEAFGSYSSSYIGQVFTEKFISAGDSSYRIRTDAIGLEEVIGISDGATVTGGASLADEPTLSYYDLVTDTEGSFTIGEKTYNVSGDSSVAITARFEAGTEPYASAFKDLDGTVSGDFTGGAFSINGSSALQVVNDTDISIVADENGFEVLGLDAGTSLQVSAAGTYTVNGDTIAAEAGDVIAGMTNGWKLDGNVASYMPGGVSTVVLGGIASVDSISVGGSFVTLRSSNFTANGVSVESNAGNYKFNLNNRTDSLGSEESTSFNGYSFFGSDGNDTITNAGDSVAIYGNGGNDFLYSASITSYVRIDGGDGDDTINARAANGTIYGGAGNDSIINSLTAANALVYGNDGDDIINNSSSNVTINAGTGDDTIVNSGANVTFQYSTDDGNDTITGFNETSKLSVAEDYSTAVSGDDLIVTVGDSKITLIDAASLSSVNIETTLQGAAATLVEMALKRTAAGYPVMAAVAFHPDENLGDEPTNYSAKEDWNITSTDDLNLHAVHYTPENSNDKWVVLIHGYGHYHNAMYVYAAAYLDNGYNVLMIDQRAAGDSEGEWLTMGAAESEDVALWTQEIARRNSNAKITLHGVSMGSATAMLAAARADATNVTSLVEDCGYTNVVEVFNLLNEVYIQQSPEVIAAMDIVAESLTGYYLHDAAPIASISSATVPSIFITGDADTVVPISMLTSLYDASGAEVKEKFIVEGAAHANAVVDDSIGYNNAVFRFVAEADGEGWTTASATNEISLRGTSYDDSITNTGTTVTITTGAGNDTIVNNVDSSVTTASLGNLIDAGEGDDYLYSNHSYHPTLLGGAGDDSIVVSRGHMTYIDGGDGNDTILGQETGDASSDWEMGGHATILGGAGDDYISPGYTNDSSIDGGDGNDTISVSGGENVTVNGGAGNDSIKNYSASSFVNGGAGDDDIENRSDYTTIFGGDGVDSIMNHTDHVSINGGAGNDSLFNGGSNNTVEGGEGDDFIYNGGANNLVYAGAGNDTVRLYTRIENVTATIDTGEGNDYVENNRATASINGGTGDDTIISNSGDNVTIDGGAGNDSIKNYSASSFVSGGAGDDEIENRSDYTTLFGGDGVDSILNHTDHVSINGGAGNDSLFNGGSNNTVEGGEGDDFIYNGGASNLVYAGAGNDTVRLYTRIENVTATIDTGEGDDYVENNRATASISGGKGNDSIVINSGDNVTVNGGAGNDYIESKVGNVLIEYAAGDGFDTIVGFDETDTLSIADKYSTSVSGNDLVLTVGTSRITLVDAASLSSPNIADDRTPEENLSDITNGYVTDYYDYGTPITDQDEVATLLSSGSLNGDMALLLEDESADFSEYSGKKSVTLTSGNQDIIFNDEGHNTAIVDEDATGAKNISLGGGGDLVFVENTGATVSVNASKGNDIIVNQGENVFVKLNGGKTDLFAAGGSMTLEGYDASTNSGFGTNYEDILTAINDGDIDFDDGKLSIASAVVDFGKDSELINLFDVAGGQQKVAFASAGSSINLSGETDDLILVGKDNSTLTGGSGNDTLIAGNGSVVDGGAGDDLLQSDAKNATLTGGAGSDTFKGGAGNFTITDYTEGEDFIYSGQSFADVNVNGSIIGNDYVFEHDDTIITVKDGANKIITGVDVNGETRLFGKYLTLDDNDPAKVTAQNGVSTIDATERTTDIKIIGSDDDNTIIAGGSNATILGGDGDDLLRSSATNTTMTGGTGSDTFKAEAGLVNLVITDYTEGEDVIYHGQAFDDFSINGSIIGGDYVFEDDEKTITVKDGANKVITIADSKGATRSFGKYLTLDDNDPATVSVQSGVATIDASARKAPIEIIGNDGDNTIISSAGNCTLYGGAGKDTFVRGSRGVTQTILVADFEEGEDKVYHGRPFEAFSLLDIADADGDEYFFETSGATIKYTDGANKKLKFVDVNGDTAYFGNWLTIRDFDADTLEATDKVKVFDAGERTKGIEIIGNSLDNSIYGGAGNDTFTGGAGDDIIDGGKGADVYVYNEGDGNDLIVNFGETDTLSIASGKYSSIKHGNDVVFMVGDGTITLQGAASLDTLNVAGTPAFPIATDEIITVFGGRNEESLNVTLDGDGNEDIDLSEEDYQVAVVDADATGIKNISLGGGDLIVVEESNALVSIEASEGLDTIVSRGANVSVNLRGGATKIYLLGGKMTLEGYEASTGAGFGTGYEDVMAALDSGNIDFNRGRLSIGSARVYFGDKDNKVLNLYDAADDLHKIGFASDNTALDTTEDRDDLILFGGRGVSLSGGIGNDTIEAGEGSYVSAGEGRNQVYLTHDKGKVGTKISLDDGGHTTVHGFKTGFDSDSDVLYTEDSISARVRFDGKVVWASVDGGAQITLEPETNNGEFAEVLMLEGDESTKLAVAKPGGTIKSKSAQIYLGREDAGVDFSDVQGDLIVNLSTEAVTADTEQKQCVGITQVTAGGGNSSLIGSSARETLTAGNGYTSIWGGAGNDYLIGKGGSEDKDGSTTFFFLSGDGHDFISDFEFLTDANRYDDIDDLIDITDANEVTDVFTSGNDVVMQINNSDDYLTLRDAVGKDFRINNLIAKVDRDIAFDGLANCYVADCGSSVNVDASVDSAEIWLDSSHGTYFLGDIRTLNASAVEGKTSLVGNQFNDTIIAGKGDASLWGGYPATDDLLIGGESQNTFFYCYGNGRDTIQGTNDGDTVILADIALDHIISSTISADAVSINFSDGGALRVEGTSDVTYRLADGSEYSANHETAEWNAATR